MKGCGQASGPGTGLRGSWEALPFSALCRLAAPSQCMWWEVSSTNSPDGCVPQRHCSFLPVGDRFLWPSWSGAHSEPISGPSSVGRRMVSRRTCLPSLEPRAWGWAEGKHWALSSLPVGVFQSKLHRGTPGLVTASAGSASAHVPACFP